MQACKRMLLGMLPRIWPAGTELSAPVRARPGRGTAAGSAAPGSSSLPVRGRRGQGRLPGGVTATGGWQRPGGRGWDQRLPPGITVLFGTLTRG